MNQIYILCIDDEPEVLEAVERDLSQLESVFALETASSAAEARASLERIQKAGDEVGVAFCDHVMPQETGVEFLTWMAKQEEWGKTRKSLLTGQAGLDATVAAINTAGLHYYVAKPWNRDDLVAAAKRLLTDYVIATEKDPLPYMAILDGARLAQSAYNKGLMSDT